MHSSLVTQSPTAFVSSSLFTQESIALMSTTREVELSTSSSTSSTTSTPVAPTLDNTFEGESSMFSYM